MTVENVSTFNGNMEKFVILDSTNKYSPIIEQIMNEQTFLDVPVSIEKFHLLIQRPLGGNAEIET